MLGDVAAPAYHGEMTADINSVVAPIKLVIPQNADIMSVSVYVARASGQVTFLVLKPVGGVASTCEFTIVARWQSPALIKAGWQTVSSHLFHH